MSVTDNLFKSILSGREGRNIGLSTSLDKIDKITYGVQRGYLTTVFADSGAGKTTFTLFSYVYSPIIKAISSGKDINILYFSFEMSSEVLFAKLLSLYLWDNYGQIVSFEEILSLTSVVDDEKYSYICDAKAWLETVEKYITIIDTPITPSQCGEVIRNWNIRFGKFIPMGDNQENYVSVKKDIYKIVVCDHVKLTKDNGKGAKNTIDELCSEFIYYRNKCGITGVFVQQANRQSKSMDRRLNGYNMLQLDDMSDSSGTAQASEIVIGIYHPHREKVNRIDKYNVKILEDRIRVIQVLKNRYGQSDKNICVSFFGEIGWFAELPPAEEIQDYENYLYLVKPNPKVEVAPQPQTSFDMNMFQL